jgi:hypothetical protein
MIGALLKQAITKLNDLPTEIVSSLRERLKKRSQLSLEEVCNVFLQIVREFRKLYICIDALDECKEKHRGILLQSLAKVSKDCKRDCFRMFVTGRPHLNWDKNIQRRFDLGSQVQICLEANPEDIRIYVEHEIDADENDECMSDALRSEILERIVDNSDRMYVCNDFMVITQC